MKSKSFQQYEAAYSSYCEKIGSKNVPREIRLFDIRFKLALGMKIDFEHIKTKAVKESYIAIFELVELWNVFEAFASWQKCKWFNLIKNDENTQKPLKKAIEQLKDLYKKKQSERLKRKV